MNKSMRKKAERLQLVLPGYARTPDQEEEYFKTHLLLMDKAREDRQFVWIMRIMGILLLVSYLVLSLIFVLQGEYLMPLFLLAFFAFLILGLLSLFSSGMSTRDYAAMIWWDRK